MDIEMVPPQLNTSRSLTDNSHSKQPPQHKRYVCANILTQPSYTLLMKRCEELCRYLIVCMHQPVPCWKKLFPLSRLVKFASQGQCIRSGSYSRAEGIVNLLIADSELESETCPAGAPLRASSSSVRVSQLFKPICLMRYITHLTLAVQRYSTTVKREEQAFFFHHHDVLHVQPPWKG